MNFKKAFISIFLIFAILSTTTVAFAASQDWNDETFEVPEGYTVGTPSSDKIGMMEGKQAVVLEYFNQEKLDELKEASEPINESTYKIEDTDVTEYIFETEDGTYLHFLKFSKDGKDYDLTYEDLKAEEEEEDSEADEAQTDDKSEDADDDNATADNATDAEDAEGADSEDAEEDDSFSGVDKESPAYIIISSLKAKG